MKTQPKLWSLLPCLLAAALASVSHAATTDIAQVPLVTSAPNAVLPNLMFVLDDSGSMNWDFLPDYVDDSRCRSGGATGPAPVSGSARRLQRHVRPPTARHAGAG